MKYLIFFLLIILCSCQSEKTYIIEGHLPNLTYDGELIFLVPFENATKDRVDSTMIYNGAFQFKGVVEKTEISIIRTRPIMRLRLQELLIVKEPGRILVHIDHVSSTSGTSLNDSLQAWKQKIFLFEQTQQELSLLFKEADDTQKQVLAQKFDSLKSTRNDYNFKLVLNNKNNVLGKFIYQVQGSSFNPEQKEKLNLK